MNTQSAPQIPRICARRGVAAALLALLALVPAQASADESGTQGRIVRLALNSTGGDDFASSHGSISVRHGGGKPEVYSWGGTMCPASKLTEAEIIALGQAFHNRQRTLIVPRFKPGEVKETRCLVGFELAAG